MLGLRAGTGMVVLRAITGVWWRDLSRGREGDVQYVRLAGTVGLAGAVQDSRYALTVYLFVPCRVATGRPGDVGYARHPPCPLLSPATASVARTTTMHGVQRGTSCTKQRMQRRPHLLPFVRLRPARVLLLPCHCGIQGGSPSFFSPRDSKRDQPNISA